MQRTGTGYAGLIGTNIKFTYQGSV